MYEQTIVAVLVPLVFRAVAVQSFSAPNHKLLLDSFKCTIQPGCLPDHFCERIIGTSCYRCGSGRVPLIRDCDITSTEVHHQCPFTPTTSRIFEFCGGDRRCIRKELWKLVRYEVDTNMMALSASLHRSISLDHHLCDLVKNWSYRHLSTLRHDELRYLLSQCAKGPNCPSQNRAQLHGPFKQPLSKNSMRGLRPKA